jgi:hypothetical protein
LDDNQWGGCRIDPKKSRRELFQQIFALRIFWGGVSSYAATPLIVALSPGHSDITRFRPWSPIATGNRLDRAEKIPKFSQTTGTVDVFDSRSHSPTIFKCMGSHNTITITKDLYLYIGAWWWLYDEWKHVARVVRKYNKYRYVWLTITLFYYFLLLLLHKKLKKKKGKHKVWIRPLLNPKRERGISYTAFDNIRKNESKSFNYFRMTVGCLHELL